MIISEQVLVLFLGVPIVYGSAVSPAYASPHHQRKPRVLFPTCYGKNIYKLASTLLHGFHKVEGTTSENLTFD